MNKLWMVVLKMIAVLRRWWLARDVSTRYLPLFIWRAVVNFGAYGADRAAALAYYTVFSIFPLTLLMTIAVSRLLGAAFAQDQIAQGLAFFLPDAATRNLLISNISQALEQNASFTIIALLGLVWSGLGLFSNLTSSLDFIFQVPKNRSLWRQRLIAVMMIVVLIVLVTASFLATGALQLLALLFQNSQNIWVDVAILLVPLGLNIVIFVMLFRYIPARYIYWDAVWPAAVVGAVGWELAKAGFTWYLANLANFQVVYGSIAAVIILLFWAYLLASILLFSAELCAQLNEWINRIHQPEALQLYIQNVPPRLPE